MDTTSTTPTTSTLVARELDAVQQLLALQGTVGAGMPPVSAGSMATLMEQLASLSTAYPTLVNPTVKGYVDQLFTLLSGVGTCYRQPFPALYITYWYRNGRLGKYDLESNVWWNYFLSGDIYYRAWPGPKYPVAWQNTIASLLTAWSQAPPSNIIMVSGDWRVVRSFEDAVLSSKWTDIGAVTAGTAALWTAQANTANALLAPQTLSAADYFFLLHLLIGLVTGDGTVRALVERITGATAIPPEYPNDVFINQLIYSSLLYLADPTGTYGWSNQQLQTYVSTLEKRMVSPDATSATIKAGLVTNGKILYSDAAYPMQDPYSPAVGFTQRQTDTLSALDQARAALRQPGARTGGAVREHLAPVATTLSSGLDRGDIPALDDLARIQGDVGAQPLTKAGLTDFMARLNTLSYNDYGAVSNAVVKGWLDLLYANLINQATKYGVPVHGLYIGYNYGLYLVGNREAWYEMSGQAFCNFKGLNASYGIPAWTLPPNSPTWNKAVTDLFNGWSMDNPPTSVIASRPGMAYEDEINFQAALFDPANWTGAGNVITGLGPLWSAQTSALQALITQRSLALSDAVLTLYLLIAMVNSASPEDRARGEHIATLPCSSPELPNDTFAGQLTYYWLMAMTDPLGSFTFTNAQLEPMLAILSGAVTNQDPGSQLLNQVFTRQAKILAADTSYPMQDPYNPSTSFPVRQTDTMAALNEAWATLSA